MDWLNLAKTIAPFVFEIVDEVVKLVKEEGPNPEIIKAKILQSITEAKGLQDRLRAADQAALDAAVPRQ